VTLKLIYLDMVQLFTFARYAYTPEEQSANLGCDRLMKVRNQPKLRPVTRGGATLCTRHAYSKDIIDNRMFTIQFENGLWSENISLKKILKLNVNLSSCLNLFSIWDLLKCMIAILVYKYCQQYLYKKVYKYCYSLPPKV
jgi:hypothetical protein